MLGHECDGVGKIRRKRKVRKLLKFTGEKFKKAETSSQIMGELYLPETLRLL